MERLLDYAKYGGKVLLFGVPPMGDSVSFDAFQIFRKGLTILSSFTSVRNSFQAIELLKTKRVNVNPLISHLLPLADFQKGVDALAGRGNVMKVLLTPNR